jgi:hypothetical protein
MSKYFFMVYLENQQAPAYKHETLKSAENEAKRLSKIHKLKAYVLCTIKSYEIFEFLEKDCRPENVDDLPF